MGIVLRCQTAGLEIASGCRNGAEIGPSGTAFVRPPAEKFPLQSSASPVTALTAGGARQDGWPPAGKTVLRGQ